MRLKPPKIIRRLMPDLIWEIDDQDGVFLTFDDGPSINTPHLLDMLEEYGIPATFFLLGNQAERHPDLSFSATRER